MAKDDEKGGAQPPAPKVEKEKVEHKNIYAALSAFQGDMKPIEQDGRVNFTTKAGDKVDFSYSTLGKIMEVIYPLLGKHGLSVRHELTDGIEAILTHETAETRIEATKKTMERNNPEEKELGKETGKVLDTTYYQAVITNELRSGKLSIKVGDEMKETSALITYAKRYTLGLVLGLATEEDKDAVLLEKSREGMEKFAFKKAQEAVTMAKGEKLDEQMTFLTKELKLAEELEAGTGKTAPSLGLKAAQYKELILLAEQQKTKGRAGNGEIVT